MVSYLVVPGTTPAGTATKTLFLAVLNATLHVRKYLPLGVLSMPILATTSSQRPLVLSEDNTSEPKSIVLRSHTDEN